jgi:4'-phosphopantetheinyl transferase
LDYVAAVINPSSAVGIDMEKMSDKLQRTARKFLSAPEFTHANNELPALCAYWCAKEAVYKQYGKKKISFKDDISILEFSASDKEIAGILRDEEEDVIVHSRIHLYWIEEHCLAIAL